MSLDDLSRRRQRFIAEYLVDRNATQAAVRAGYSAATAYAQGCRLLKDADVARAISELSQRQFDRLEITADDIVREAWEIATHAKSESARVSALTLLAKRHPEFRDGVNVDARSVTLALPPEMTVDELRTLRAELLASG